VTEGIPQPTRRELVLTLAGIAVVLAVGQAIFFGL
jgi:hypothetical protein